MHIIARQSPVGFTFVDLHDLTIAQTDFLLIRNLALCGIQISYRCVRVTSR